MRILTAKSLSLALLAVVLALTQMNAAQQPDNSGVGQWVELSFRLPAIGNTGQVKEWEYGRIASISRRGADDMLLTVRDKNGSERQIVCPTGPFTELARISNWMTESNTSPTSRDCIERMVAFAVDDTSRTIAMVSLEPLPRNGRRIANAFGR